MRIRGAFLLALLAAQLLGEPLARAGEEEWVVTPSLGYAVLRSDGRDRHGGILYFDVDYGLTWTCYDPQPGVLSCGQCDACRLRIAAFERLGLRDPLPYVGLESPEGGHG